MYSRRILLVEDDPNDYELLFQAMERTGLAYQIDLASSISEALDKLFRLDNHHLRHRHSLHPRPARSPFATDCYF